MRRTTSLALLTTAVALPYCVPAQPGSLDPLFGNGGVLANDRYGARSIALTATEDILVLTGSDGVLMWDSSEFPPVEFIHTVPWLQRYTANGSLDVLFGDQGTIEPGAAFPGFGADHVLVQPDDRIVLVGHGYWPGNVLTPAVARLLPDGEPDLLFGTGGLAMLDPGLADDVHARGALLDGAGRVVVFGRKGTGNADIAVVRWSADGSLDPAFGNGGLVLLDLGGDPATGTDRIEAAVLMPDDGLLLTGRCHNGTAPKVLFVGRLLGDGTPDAGFGNNGFSIDALSGPPWTEGTSVALLNNGSVLVAGSRTVPGPVTFTRRYLANGQLDLAFGLAGELNYPIGTGASAIVGLLPIMDGGALWLAGDTGAVVGQFTADGAPQLSFGTAGRTNVFTQQWCQPTDFLQYPDGRVLVSGNAMDGDGIQHLQIYRTAGAATGWLENGALGGLNAAVLGSPWTELSTLVVRSERSGPFKVDMLDCQGKVVAHVVDNPLLAPGEHRFQLRAMAALAHGLYVLRIRNAQGELSMSIVR